MPATGTSNTFLAPRRTFCDGNTTGSPARVSATRTGASDVNPAPAGNQPLTSTITSVPTLEYTHAIPPAPTPVSTAFATTCPAVKFRFDAFGRATPHGNTVKNPAPSGDTAVTFNDTAPAFAGTPNLPATGTSNTFLAPRRTFCDGNTTGSPARVSATRTGTATGVKGVTAGLAVLMRTAALEAPTIVLRARTFTLKEVECGSPLTTSGCELTTGIRSTQVTPLSSE